MSDSAPVFEKMQHAREKIFTELRKAIVGQDEVIDQIITTLFAGGHGLLMGVPGLGKTLLVKSIASMFSLDFKRIQFTPDLMPADITGTELIEEDPESGKRSFRFAQGPVFANMILADELNRTPPKTQSALLEAMGEGHITAGGDTHTLPQPFFVLATQNPIELEGTYPLPEAQLDRFLMSIQLDYLPADLEEEMVAATTGTKQEQPGTLFNAEEVLELQQLVRDVAVSRDVINFAVRLVRSTRPDNPDAPENIKRHIKWGAGSRASQALIMTGKARALLNGRLNVDYSDLRALALPVLRHRVITNFHADAEGITASRLITELLDNTPDLPQ